MVGLPHPCRVQEAQASRQKLEVEAAKVRRELADTEKLLALVRPALPPAAPPATEVVVAAAEAEAAPAQGVEGLALHAVNC